MFMSVCAFSIMDLIVKWSDSYPLGQVLFLEVFWSNCFYFFLFPEIDLKIFIIQKTWITFLKMFFGLIAFFQYLLL